MSQKIVRLFLRGTSHERNAGFVAGGRGVGVEDAYLGSTLGQRQTRGGNSAASAAEYRYFFTREFHGEKVLKI